MASPHERLCECPLGCRAPHILGTSPLVCCCSLLRPPLVHSPGNKQLLQLCLLLRLQLLCLLRLLLELLLLPLLRSSRC